MNSSNRNNLWKQELDRRLQEFGHRNWIVVADAAYPSQSNSGIETIVTSSSHLDVLDRVLKAVAKQPHIRPQIRLDSELKAVSDQDAPGVHQYRQRLSALLKTSEVVELNHEEIIAKLDTAASLFRVLILKTTFAIPYSSVFLELDCGYWSSDREVRLRATIARQSENI
jgi:D-ribose pyranose/furanose isomerase RbsD